MPKNLVARYSEAANDPRLISLGDEVALVDVRVSQLLEALGETGNTRLWKDARTKFDAFKAAGGKGKSAVGSARAALQAVDDILAAGLSAAATWDELRETLDLRRRLLDSETKRLKDLHQMISVGTALAMLVQLVDVVKSYVSDPVVLAALSDQFARLAGGGGSPALEA